MLRGSIKDHYVRLRSYKAELLRVDPDGRYEFFLEDDLSLKGFYIGFSLLYILETYFGMVVY